MCFQKTPKKRIPFQLRKISSGLGGLTVFQNRGFCVFSRFNKSFLKRYRLDTQKKYFVKKVVSELRINCLIENF